MYELPESVRLYTVFGSSISTNSKTANSSVLRPVPYYLTSEKYSLAIKLLNYFMRLSLTSVCSYCMRVHFYGRECGPYII